MEIEYEELKSNRTPPKSKKDGKNFLTVTEKSKAYVYKKSGRRISDIADDLDRPVTTVTKFLDKALGKKLFDHQFTTQGRFQKGTTILTERHKKLILEWINGGMYRSSQEVYDRLRGLKNLKQVGYDVVNNYIKTIGDWVVPRLKTIISLENQKKRRDYCRSNIENIILEDVLFTDESMFELNRNTLKQFKFKDEAMPEIEKLSTYVRQMVWAGVSLKGKTRIYFVEGWINNEKYVELLKEARKDMLSLFPDGFSFLQDNARPHVHQNSMRYLKRWISSQQKNHPPQSPDLNPIELVWNELKDLVEEKRPKTKAELRDCILKSWEEIPQEFINKCIEGLPKRMQKAIEDADSILDVQDNN